jgi:hypothetical protein
MVAEPLNAFEMQIVRFPVQDDTVKYIELVEDKFTKEAIIRWYISHIEDGEAVIEIVVRKE